MRVSEILLETVAAIHRTSSDAARAIRDHGFRIDAFGTGAGAGSGEPAGVFLSVGDGGDFSKENDRRRLNLNTVIPVRVHAKNILQWDADARIAFVKQARIEFLQSRFNIAAEDAVHIIRYSVRVMQAKPELDKIANWLDTPEGERNLALFINTQLQADGYDAVEYRDPWQGVQQMIVLDPSIIEIAS